MSERVIEPIEQSIMDVIDKVREEHNACTGRAVALALNMSPETARYWITKLRGDGLVAHTDMPGSLTVMHEAVEAATAPSTPDEAEPPASPQDESQPAPTTPRPKKAAVKKKAAAKKAAARKRSGAARRSK